MRSPRIFWEGGIGICVFAEDLLGGGDWDLRSPRIFWEGGIGICGWGNKLWGADLQLTPTGLEDSFCRRRSPPHHGVLTQSDKSIPTLPSIRHSQFSKITHPLKKQSHLSRKTHLTHPIANIHPIMILPHIPSLPPSAKAQPSPALKKYRPEPRHSHPDKILFFS